MTLCAVIEVDPYMAPHTQIGSHWKEVTNHVQAAGYCLGQDHETLKNKVTTPLSWVEGGKAKKTHSPLGREAEENEVLAASLLGKLDSAAAKKQLTKETKEANKAQRAKVHYHCILAYQLTGV
ncbi:hypothetical protein K439DRAFT_1617905 [Ramaria rubella]|nr:hypothetical protein K439DRAFT_1617905 [Ramaria rubella]